MSRLPKVLAELPDHRGDGDHRESLARELSELGPLQHALGYCFGRPALLRVALTLGSWSNEHRRSGWPSNACLEFFGDAVLDLLAADALWQRFPTLGEGELTRLRALMVSEPSLADAARALDLGAWLYLGRGDEMLGGRAQARSLADAVEAILGAVFLDAREAGRAPLDEAGVVFHTLFGRALATLQPQDGLDPKSRLQQWAQAKHRLTPVYVRVGDRPPPDDPCWGACVELRHPDGRVEVLGRGQGRSLREAERAAAAEALSSIGPQPDQGDGSSRE